MYQKDFSSKALDIIELLKKESTQERDKLALLTLFLRAAYQDGWQDSLNSNFEKKREL